LANFTTCSKSELLANGFLIPAKLFTDQMTFFHITKTAQDKILQQWTLFLQLHWNHKQLYFHVYWLAQQYWRPLF